MSFSSWLRNWKASLERRSALNQILRRRSSGRRFVPRPRLEELEDRTVLSTFLVTNTGDNGGVNPAAGADTGTLRQAIVDADAAGTGTAANPDQIQFAIPTTDPGYNSATGAFTIQPLSALPTITDTVVLDATSQPGFTVTPIIVLDGASAGSGVVGLTITAGNSTVKGLDINQFSGDGIDLTTNGGDTIQSDYIGTDVTGNVALANGGNGITINNVGGNTIGGAATAARNIISGNTANGVEISGSSATGNIVEGDYIGTDVTGSVALGNGGDGVLVEGGATNNTIGGLTGTPGTGAGNVISGNRESGITLNSDSNLVQGNLVGLNAAGTAALGNGSAQVGGLFGGNDEGIHIDNAANNIIGGTTASARNIISANEVDGVQITGSSSTGNLVEGNYVGTDITGTQKFGNHANGVGVDTNSTGDTIGGTATGAGNVISGNQMSGIVLFSVSSLIEGNLIGTNAAGTAALANLDSGVAAFTASNTIGGAVANAGNVISGNGTKSDKGDGIVLWGGGTTGNWIAGNRIGTDASGTVAISNGWDGIGVNVGASGTTIGGTVAAARNVVAANGGHGIEEYEAGPGTLIEGNYARHRGELWRRWLLPQQ
jgi:hypothetical protein